MSNKKISDLAAAGLALQDVDLIEGEFAAGGTSRKFTGLEVRTIEMEERILADEAIHDAVGLDASGNFIPFTLTNYIDASTTIAEAIVLLDDAVSSLNSVSQGDLTTVNVANGSGGWIDTHLKIKSDQTLYNSVASTEPYPIATSITLADTGEVFIEALGGFYLSATEALLRNIDNDPYELPVDEFDDYIPDSLVTVGTLLDLVGSLGTVNTVNIADGDGGWKEAGLEIIDSGSGFNTFKSKTADHNFFISDLLVGFVVENTGEFILASDTAIIKTSNGSTFVVGDENSLVNKAYVDLAASTGGGVGVNNVTVVTALYSATINDKYILSNNPIANVEVQLPSINTLGGKVLTLTFRKVDAGAWALTIQRASSDEIWFDGDADATGLTTTTQGAWITLVSGVGKWYVVQGGTDWAITV